MIPLAFARPKSDAPRLQVETLSDALGSIQMPAPSQDTELPEIVRRWAAGDLWHGVPHEFRGAKLPDGIRTMLNRRPKTLALVGPPGTGKTRILWAMVHSMRSLSMRDLIGTELIRQEVADGDYSARRQSYRESIEDELSRRDGMEIITESADIRAKRFDRLALSGWAYDTRWLAVDDIGCVEPNEWVREALYFLANERRSAGLHTVWTSNLSIQQLRDTFGAAIASRILGGEVIEIGGDDRRLIASHVEPLT